MDPGNSFFDTTTLKLISITTKDVNSTLTHISNFKVLGKNYKYSLNLCTLFCPSSNIELKTLLF